MQEKKLQKYFHLKKYVNEDKRGCMHIRILLLLCGCVVCACLFLPEKKCKKARRESFLDSLEFVFICLRMTAFPVVILLFCRNVWIVCAGLCSPRANMVRVNMHYTSQLCVVCGIKKIFFSPTFFFFMQTCIFSSALKNSFTFSKTFFFQKIEKVYIAFPFHV